MRDVEDRLDDIATANDFSGVVRIDRSSATELTKAYGLADRRHRIPMTIDTQLAVASGSKTLTALVVMSLVEDRGLTLATTAREILGDDLPLIAGDVTVEHLLAHRSGIGDYLDEDDQEISDYPMPVSVHRLGTTEQFLEVLGGHQQKFPAGDRFSYCNSGYVVLALLAERITGTTYHDLVRQRVCTPAGMTDTDFLRSDDLPGRAALGYVEVDGSWRTNVFHLPVVGNGDGGIYTTVTDVHRFWAALFGARIVSAATLEEILLPRSTHRTASSTYHYGLGLWTCVDGEQAFLDGCDAGVSFRSVHCPSRGNTDSVIANTTDGAWAMSEAIASTFDG